MQTFFAYSSFFKTAVDLDQLRLGKQRVEAYQILEHLLGVSGSERFYPNHPIMAMWDGYEYALTVYGMQTCDEWKRRGHQDSLWWKFHAYGDLFVKQGFQLEKPPWWNDEALMRTHRSNLYRKDPHHYRKFRSQGPDMPYLWPRVADDGTYTLWLSAAELKRYKAGERKLPKDLVGRAANL